MAKMPLQVKEKFNMPGAIKFMATVDAQGFPNCVPISSVRAIDDDKLAFADYMINKTKKNLLVTRKVAVTVLAPNNIAYQVKGSFEGFQTSGPVLDYLANLPEYRFHAYMGPRAAGIIKVRRVYTACSPLPGKEIRCEE